MEVVGNIPLYIRLGALCTRDLFNIADNLALTLLLSKRYIDKVIKGIFSMERLVEPAH